MVFNHYKNTLIYKKRAKTKNEKMNNTIMTFKLFFKAW